MWYHKLFLILAPPNILFIDNKKILCKNKLTKDLHIYIFDNIFQFPAWIGIIFIFFYLPTIEGIENIIRYVRISLYTACGHNDFCSVRLNGPILGFILTHKYRLSLSQFTEAVMIESATGPLLLRKSRSLPTQKCHAPPAVAESSCFIDVLFFWYSLRS